MEIKRSRRQSAEDVRTMILDVAERMFAELGFHGVSIRDITQASGTRLASVNYYFDSKSELLTQIISRRYKEVNEERRVRLDAIMSMNGKREQTAFAIVDAFAVPLIDRVIEKGDGWDNYVRLLAQLTAQRSLVAPLISPFYDEIALRFVNALQTLAPDMSEYVALCTYQFIVGTTLAMLAQNGRMDVMSAGKYRSDDLRSIYANLRVFLVRGIIGIMDEEPKSKAFPAAKAQVLGTESPVTTTKPNDTN